MCFQGTASDVSDLAFTVKAATNSTFRLDRENCIVESSYRSLGNQKFDSLRADFGEFISAEQTFTIAPTADATSAQIAPFRIDVYMQGGTTYRTGSRFGQCDGGEAQLLPEQLIAHEMIHHQPELSGKPLPAGTAVEERRATVRGDNAFNAAVGRRQRCAYP